MRNRPVIVVVGGIGMDLVVRAAFPAPGETVEGTDLQLVAGGKGGNHAVAAVRLGAAVHLVGRVGTDEIGSRLLSDLENQGVSTTFVTVTEGVASGTAITVVEPATGENAVVASPGANSRLTAEDVDRAEPMVKSASGVLLSLDVPREVVAHTVAMCHRHRVPVILNAGYVPPWAAGGERLGEVLNVTVLCPNQSGAVSLLGGGRQAAGGPDPAQARGFIREPKLAAVELLAKGPAEVVLRLGAAGAMYADAAGTVLAVPAFKVKVKDTTAAGDAFTAALAVARAEGMAVSEAVRFANAAGALSSTVAGAQPSLPKREDVDQVVARWG